MRLMTNYPRRMLICITMTAFVMLSIPWTAHAVNYGVIRPGETRTGAIAVVTQTDTFTFDGVAGQTIIITMSRVSNIFFNPQFDLYDPDGIRETGYWGDPAAQISNYKLKKTGIYTIVCSENGQNATGDYAVTLTQIPVPAIGAWNPDCGAILGGQTMLGSISTVSSADTFTFDGVASQTVIITMSWVSNNYFNPQFDVYDPDGIRETGYWGDPAAQVSNHKLQKTGIYTIVCSAYGQHTTGDYAVTLTQIPVPAIGAWNPDCGAILSGQTLKGAISVVSSADTFTFDGVASQTMIITMSWVSNIYFNPQFDVYDPDGIRETGYWGDPAAQVSNHKLQKTGIYTIVCSAYGQNTTGDYAISLSKIPGAALSWKDLDGGEILPGQILSGQIGTVSDADSFRFTARSSDTVIITMSRSFNIYFNPLIDLYDPDGIWETGGWGDPTAQISNYKLKKTGTYTIVCSGYGQDITGAYNLSLNQIPPVNLGLVQPFPRDGGFAWVDVTLRWDASPSATGYDVYLGTTEPLSLVAQNIAQTEFRPVSALTLGDSYLWQVVAHRPQGDMPGPMYLFRTTIPAVRLRDYLLGKVALTPEELFAADVNMDTRVDIADLIAIYLRGY
ncbi:MAG: dockerin type I repeat-containing protein [Candidatus Sumerlaeota bacterium]|nr:dockerin type I repeat-containing protein [Candidatus Sumerlaeota bacterium]